MSRRGGRGGGKGGARNVPDMSWEDEEGPPTATTLKPPPTFPRLDFPVPVPIGKQADSIDSYLELRARSHQSRFFATLNSSSLTNDKGKVDPRAGFDPFNHQDVYSQRFEKTSRTVPDLTGRAYALQFFPKELWPLLDPKRKDPLWKTLGDQDKERQKKRKRKKEVAEEEVEEGEKEPGSDDDSDVPLTGARKKNASKKGKKDGKTSQKKGLDAEDDYPDDQHDSDENENSDEPQDSEFEEDDEEGDDYNAEQYFEDGEGDEYGDDGGADGGEEGYY